MKMTDLNEHVRNSNLPGGVSCVRHNMKLDFWPDFLQIPSRRNLRSDLHVKERTGMGG